MLINQARGLSTLGDPGICDLRLRTREDLGEAMIP
jgi:hypothetical protein